MIEPENFSENWQLVKVFKIQLYLFRLTPAGHSWLSPIPDG
jgi:hypothetical protein